jgi:photosystem II stability/assembly factor-like uncharacterized protein
MMPPVNPKEAPVRRSIVLALAVVAAALGSPAAADASIWTPITSGTSSDITAVEYQSDTRFWYATRNGEIFTRNGDGTFSLRFGPTFKAFNDIEFKPGSTLGFAVGDNGEVVRSTDGGQTWTDVNPSGTPIPVSAPDTTFPTCDNTYPLGNVNAVRFAGANRVYIFAQGAQMARSENAGDLGAVGTWQDANRTASNTCKMDTGYAAGIDDGFFVPANPDVGWICTGYFGRVFFTASDMGSVTTKGDTCGNGSRTDRVLAGDPNNPNRQWALSPGGADLSYTAYTEDGWATYNKFGIGNPDKRAIAESHDLAYNGGTVLGVGDTGMVLTSVDGKTFYFNDDDGPDAGTPWYAAALASASSGAIGGKGGRLSVTTQANVTPDKVNPVVTSLTGPATAAVGQSVSFTATAIDSGGSGVDPNGFQWSATGLTPTTAASATYTFPDVGTYGVTVRAKDKAGNLSEPVTKTITVGKPAFAAATKAPLVGGAARRRGGYVVLKVKGRFTPPAGVSAAAACKGNVFIRVLKNKRLLTARVVKLSSTCRYKKTIRIKRKKVGRAKRLKLRITFAGNQALAGSTRTYTVKVK